MQTSAAQLLASAVREDERIAFLGDSITQAGAKPNGYVDRIRAVLARERPGVGVIPAGISGHKVPNLLARFRRDVVEKNGMIFVWHHVEGKPPEWEVETIPEIGHADWTEPRLVMLGVGDWDNTEVVSGVEPGETLVIVGAAQLQARQQEFLDRMRGRNSGSPFGGGGPGGRGRR